MIGRLERGKKDDELAEKNLGDTRGSGFKSL